MRIVDQQTGPHNSSKTRRKFYLMAAIAVVFGVLLRGTLVAVFTGTEPSHPTTIKLPSDGRAQVRERLEPSLVWAERESQKAVADNLRRLDDFFADAKKRTPAFAKDVLGWRSKWYLAVDKMPFTRTGRQMIFLRGAFNDDIFSQEQLTQVLNQLVKDYDNSLMGIENRMLVKMKADISDLPPSFRPSFGGNESQLKNEFNAALAQAKERARADLKADVGREVTSVVVGEILTVVAVRMSVEGGILAAGAASSWETFGIGLAASIIVDQAVSWVWDWWRNPIGDLSGKMNDKLDEIHRLMVDGDGTHLGLCGRLAELSKNRAQLRRAAIDKMTGVTEDRKP